MEQPPVVSPNLPEIESFKCTQYKYNDQCDLLHMTIKPVYKQSRPPIALFICIDVSGSMSSASSIKYVTDAPRLTALELVQHSLKTIIGSLEPEDRIEMLAFDHRLREFFPLTHANDESKRAMLDFVAKLPDGGSTNIWAALEPALQHANEVKDCICNVLVFTDGESDVPKGGLPKNIRTRMGDFTVSTFGFGKENAANMLQEMAQVGGGVYSYICDATMCGTVFTNYIGSIMTTQSQNLPLLVDDELHKVTLYNGRQRDVLLKVDSGTFHNVRLRASDAQIMNPTPLDDKAAIEDAIVRQQTIDLISEICTVYRGDSQDKVQAFADTLSSRPNQTPFQQALLIDIIDPHPNHGQVIKAVSNERFFNEWGMSYLLNLRSSLSMQYCANFKDQALQTFATDDFEAITENIKEIFLSIEVVCSNTQFPNQHRMAALFDVSGGCFDGDALVSMASGQPKKVRDLKKGDTIEGGAVVKCVVSSLPPVVNYGVNIRGVIFSPYHPVLINADWVFPVNQFPKRRVKIDAWFNIVLDGGSEITLNGVTAITLGHGRTEGILAHHYFGTTKCISDLKRYDSYDSGHVSAGTPKVTRDSITNLIQTYY